MKILVFVLAIMMAGSAGVYAYAIRPNLPLEACPYCNGHGEYLLYSTEAGQFVPSVTTRYLCKYCMGAKKVTTKQAIMIRRQINGTAVGKIGVPSLSEYLTLSLLEPAESSTSQP